MRGKPEMSSSKRIVQKIYFFLFCIYQGEGRSIGETQDISMLQNIGIFKWNVCNYGGNLKELGEIMGRHQWNG